MATETFSEYSLFSSKSNGQRLLGSSSFPAKLFRISRVSCAFPVTGNEKIWK